MKKLTFSLLIAGVSAIGLSACSTTQERITGAGTGVVAGAAVAGPVGAVVGGVGGAIVAPTVARDTGFHHRRYYYRHHHRYYYHHHHHVD